MTVLKTTLLVTPHVTGDQDIGQQQKNVKDIKRAIGQARLDLGRDDVVDTRQLDSSLLKRAYEAEIVVVDANRYKEPGDFPIIPYLVGMRHALNKRTILVALKETELPFDPVNHHAIRYLRADLGDFLDRFEKLVQVIQSGVDEYPDNPIRVTRAAAEAAAKDAAEAGTKTAQSKASQPVAQKTSGGESKQPFSEKITFKKIT